jgi:hypothetical protein
MRDKVGSPHPVILKGCCSSPNSCWKSCPIFVFPIGIKVPNIVLHNCYFNICTRISTCLLQIRLNYGTFFYLVFDLTYPFRKFGLKDPCFTKCGINMASSNKYHSICQLLKCLLYFILLLVGPKIRAKADNH